MTSWCKMRFFCLFARVIEGRFGWLAGFLPGHSQTLGCRQWLSDRKDGVLKIHPNPSQELCLVICAKHCYRIEYHMSQFFWFRKIWNLGSPCGNWWTIWEHPFSDFPHGEEESTIFVSSRRWSKPELALWLMGFACIHLAKLFSPWKR